jgi:hypothetical protein
MQLLGLVAQEPLVLSAKPSEQVQSCYGSEVRQGQWRLLHALKELQRPDISQNQRLLPMSHANTYDLNRWELLCKRPHL